jgi:hypothetical protein
VQTVSTDSFDKIITVVMTDGEENSSRETTITVSLHSLRTKLQFCFAIRNNGLFAWENCSAQIEISEFVIQRVCNDIVPENPVQWLNELKAMTKDIAMSQLFYGSLSRGIKTGYLKPFYFGECCSAFRKRKNSWKRALSTGVQCHRPSPH